ncbi:MAG: hypothetical protein IJ078_04930 [Succinivibrionaceae bacterium]|jgi:hypothetical protein|nr:hypothetical protein [Succinivibrionaceae bacterium]
MSLLKDLDEPKSSKYTFSDFWSDFSWDSLQNKVDQAQKEMDDLFAELDAIRERKKQIGIGYYFEKLGDRMRRAITVINEEDAKDTNEDSKK